MRLYVVMIVVLLGMSCFSVAEDDSGIYFSRRGEDQHWSIYFHRFADKSTIRVLHGDGYDYGTPASSPDGKYLAFTTNKGGRYDLVYWKIGSQDPYVYVTTEANNSHPTWSADGKSIAYVGTRNQKTEIFVYNITTKKEVSITSFFPIAGQPSWHPCDNKIAFCGNEHIAAYDGRNDIFVVDLDTKEYQKITPGNDLIKESHPAWDSEGNLFFDQANIEYSGGFPMAKDSCIVRHSSKKSVIFAKGDKFYSYPAPLPNTKHLVFLRHEANFRFSIVLYENERFITELTFGHTDRTPRFGHFPIK